MGNLFRERDNYVRIVELTPALRKRIEATVEHLLEILDDYDGDTDLEPSLGWPERSAGYGCYELEAQRHCLTDDREADDEREIDDDLEHDGHEDIDWERHEEAY